ARRGMKRPRGLSREEAALWWKVTATVTPLHRLPRDGEEAAPRGSGQGPAPRAAGPRPSLPPPPSPAPPAEDRGKTPPLSADCGLDASWDRRLRSGMASPAFTLDLHGQTLAQAHRRLDMGPG